MTDDVKIEKRRGPRIVGLILLLATMLVVGIAVGIALTRWHSATQPPTPASATKQLWTCSMHPQVIRAQPGNCPICGMALAPIRQHQQDERESMIQIDPVMVQNMGVRTTPVTRGVLQREVRAVGMLEQPQPRLYDINLRVSGWIEKLYADTEGMRVEQGQPLFELYSPEIQVGVQELITARRNQEQRGDDASEALRRMAKVTNEAARQKLSLWGLTDQQIDELAQLDQPPRTVTFLSPVTAEVVEKMVVQGSAVNAGERILRLADRSVMWINIRVFEQDLPFISLGQAAMATVEAFPGESFAGQVTFIQPRVDEQTRTVLARIEINNPDLTLRPGLYATARLDAKPADSTLLVPREAVIDTGVRQVVFVSAGDGHFEARPVKTGSSDASGSIAVLEGLAEGEQVVTSGQFLLDAESRMREAIRKYQAQGLAAPAEHQH